MRVLILNYEFPPIGGGAGKANLCLLKEFAGNDELVIDVLTSSPQPGFTVEQFAENITIYKVGLHKKNLHYWRKIEVLEWLFKAGSRYRRLLGANNYDLAHAFFAFPTGYLCYRTAYKLPYIVSLRGSDVPGYNVRLSMDYKLLSGLFRRIWTRASAVIANSTGLARLAADFIGDLDIRVIPNGVYTDIFSPAARQNSQPVLQVLTVCRLISRKRIDLLIKAIAQVKMMGTEVCLNIAGEGNLMGQLQSLAKSSGLAEQVNFLGRLPAEQMPDLYRNNDIFIMCSAHEGMSNAMLEAMASGLPIITTRCEGAEELINDNGIVVEQPNAELIADAIKTLADAPELQCAMALAAAKGAESFRWETVAEKYIRCYRKICQNGRL